MSFGLKKNVEEAVIEIQMPCINFSLLCRGLTYDETNTAWGLQRANKISGVSGEQSNAELFPLILRMSCVGWKGLLSTKQDEDLSLKIILEKINDNLSENEKIQLANHLINWSLVILKHKGDNRDG